MLCCEQLRGRQLGAGGGGTHEERSQIMYSRIFSWGAKAVSHSAGNVWPFEPPELVTWKSLNIACPHWLVAATGVLNVKCSTIEVFLSGSVPSIQSTDPPVTPFASWRGFEIDT
jgi:hypothetical protein